jgi:NAD(P)-dependent dehydrogenase (short-subunit alcohol dehydrogenase family)
MTEDHSALIIGGGKGIGLALANNLAEKGYEVTTTSRHDYDLTQHPKVNKVQLDPLNEEQIGNFIKDTDLGNLDIVIYCVGTLQDDHTKPEKSLRDIDVERLLHSFKVNAVGFPLLAKHLKGKLKKDGGTKIIAISAKVGSIDDNELGGWYGYRASKTALNMFVRNTAIELKRNNYDSSVYAIHPGTTATDLSSGYLKNTKLKVHTTEQTAENILNVVSGLTHDDTGYFYSWDGTRLPF